MEFVIGFLGALVAMVLFGGGIVIDGKLYSGSGVSADIVAASIRAYVNALNKIVFEEE